MLKLLDWKNFFRPNGEFRPELAEFFHELIEYQSKRDDYPTMKFKRFESAAAKIKGEFPEMFEAPAQIFRGRRFYEEEWDSPATARRFIQKLEKGWRPKEAEISWSKSKKVAKEFAELDPKVWVGVVFSATATKEELVMDLTLKKARRAYEFYVKKFPKDQKKFSSLKEYKNEEEVIALPRVMQPEEVYYEGRWWGKEKLKEVR